MAQPSALAVEYGVWKRNMNFFSQARGNLRGKLLDEMNNVLCRLMLSLYNFPGDQQSVKEKANSELNEKRIRKPLPYHLLEKRTLAITPRVISDVVMKDLVHVQFDEFKRTLPRKRYEFLIEKACLEEIGVMLMRYDSMLCNTGQFWGLPPKVWEKLRENYGVEYEGFACPLNSTLPKFFSLFPDVDSKFGSQGNFLTSTLTPGVYAINPPYIEGVMVEVVKKVFELLERDAKSVCFFLLPYWMDSPGIIPLVESKYCVGKVVLEKHKHSVHNYITDETMTAHFGNLFLCLTNDSSFRVNLEDLRRAF